MPVIRLLCLTVVLFTPAMLVAADIEVEPADPTSLNPVTLVVNDFGSCPPPPVLTRSGSTITVALSSDFCLYPPIPIRYRLEVGVLPAGQYDAVVTQYGRIVTTATFVVLDANDSVVVRPSLGRSRGGMVVEIIADVKHCAGRSPESCPPPTITFGGLPATDITVISSRTFRATTPPHPAGAVEVRVTSEDVTKASHAFRYYDPEAAPLAAVFERILFPVIYNGAGAHGSLWKTELSVRNTNGYTVELWRAVNDVAAIPTGRPLSFGSEDAPGGLLLVVPREAAPGLHFSSSVLDLSRQTEAAGTEIRVVREREFSPSIDLLDIPIGPGFRHNLRIYALEPIQSAGVTVYSMVSGFPQPHGGGDVSFHSPQSCDPFHGCSVTPAFARVDDLLSSLQFVPGMRVGIRVQAYGVPVWAFMTITNNETQHVSVRSPQ